MQNIWAILHVRGDRLVLKPVPKIFSMGLLNKFIIAFIFTL